MFTNNNFLLVTIICLLSLSSCHTSKNQQSNDLGEQTAEGINGSWSLTNFHDTNIILDQSNRSIIPTLEVNVTEKKVAGKDGCNSIFATLSKLEGQEITIGPIGGTKMGCRMENPYDEQYRHKLRAARTYVVRESVLTLMDAQNNILLEFTKINN